MKQRRFAFTLVEILVVLAVIALLAALLFTVFSRVREGERGAVCSSNQRQILLALQLYQEDAAGHFPFYRGIPDVHSTVWIDALLPYVKTPPLFVCPSDAQIENKQIYGYVTTIDDGIKHPTVPSSYIANWKLLWKNEKGEIRPLALSELASPAAVVFASDGVKQASPRAPFWTDRDDTINFLPNGLAATGYILRDPFGAQEGNNYVDPVAPNPRHNGRANVGFVDGHVKSMDLSKWYFPHTPFLDPARGG